jgi:hypothetical protein
MAGLIRATVFAVKEEATEGVYAPPSAGSDFIPLRPGNTLNFEPELLESDELLNDIGASKSSIGKEAVSGSHSAYLKHSGVEGQAPEASIFYESLFGSKVINAAGTTSTVGSTVSLLEIDDLGTYVQGQAVLVKDASNGYSIRNVSEVTVGGDLVLNFNLPGVPAIGTALGRSVLYSPVAQGHPSFSTSKYLGNGHAIEVAAGNQSSEMSITADANGFGEVEFSYSGTKYYFNPITITSSNKFLDFIDDYGTWNVSIAEKIYKTPIELAEALTSAMNTISPNEVHSVSFSSVNGKFTIKSEIFLTLQWSSGTNYASSIGQTIGFDVATNDTGALTYTSDDAQLLTAAYTPSYDSAENIIIKGAQLFIGGQSDNICICAQSVSITVSKELEDEDCICEESGVSSKIPTSRSVEMSVTATLNKYDASLLDALIQNKSVSAMFNAGPKAGGNFIPGKCFNFYMQTATVSAYTTTGDSFIQAEFTLKGYVTTSTKDGYLNFV